MSLSALFSVRPLATPLPIKSSTRFDGRRQPDSREPRSTEYLSGNVEAIKIADALDVIRRQELARCESIEGQGRPTERWFASEKALSAQKDGKRWPSPLASDAFYGLAGAIVKVIDPYTEADPAALLVQFLTAFGNVIGRGAYFPIEATRHYFNLYVVLVGQTSRARKSTSWEHVARVFEAAEQHAPMDESSTPRAA